MYQVTICKGTKRTRSCVSSSSHDLVLTQFRSARRSLPVLPSSEADTKSSASQQTPRSLLTSRRFFSVFPSHQLSSCLFPKPDASYSFPPVSSRGFVTLPSHLLQGLAGCLFPTHFTTKIPEGICFVLVFSMCSSHNSVSSVTSLWKVRARFPSRTNYFSLFQNFAAHCGVSLEIRRPDRESNHASAPSRRLRKSAAAVEYGMAV